MIKYILFGFLLMHCSTLYSQSDSLTVSKTTYNSINNCITTEYNGNVVSKEINTKLFYYKANYHYGTKSFIEAKLNLQDIFDTIIEFLDSNLKASLTIIFPGFEFHVISEWGRYDYFKMHYYNDKIQIFRDCRCGVYRRFPLKGNRVYMGSFTGSNNQLFERRSRFYLRYRRTKINDFTLDINLGLPTQFLTYQDSNILDKKVIFKNGLVDTLESYYNNGNLRYKFSILNGALNGDFIYLDSIGNELLKVYFVENKVNIFDYQNMRYEYDKKSKSWLSRYRVFKTKQTDRKW